ncbi:hypothetical protein VitviT2T_018965 [Vitis vinifera]|uniref:Protein kinase domain-containing protein n=3 Tax=Vitis vinifera TaxID=29760 RepID=A0ABY9CZR1_VITVI|nr:putative serine/threonine-protein kinase-like protein CCR3 [Vitis vinifera]WKA00627.1 hypothetical protein VitviT2T_018965 [Vitis vinifera]|eukprot:XP_002272022.2 PREDICTED: putative serine/threonine-protein kinase-like protein CCR3 [Vitis vinifera]
MTMTPLSVAVAAVVTVVIAAVSSPALVHGLGSGSTLAVSYGSGAVCGVVAGERYQRIECYRGGETISIEPNISSFSSISGGRDFFCGLRSGGFALFCWNTSFVAKRIYFNYTVLLENLAVGDDQVCATVNGTGVVKCWRGENSSSLSESSQFSSISSGLGFSCGILVNNRTVQCWGSNTIANQIQQEFGNTPMLSIMAGGSHVCGLNTTGYLLCEGSNDSGQLNVPSGSAYEFSNLSLGENHSCAIRQSNGSVVCWGGGGEFSTNATNGISFESIVSGLNFTCGLITTNYSIICWGPGWPSSSVSGLGLSPLPLSIILPGPCVQSSSCECVYPGSQYLCYGSEVVCKPCRVLVPGSPVPLSPVSPPSVSPPSSPSRALSRGLLAFAIVGSVGAFSGICTIIYCLWTGVCCGHKKIHNSVQPTIARGNSNGGANSNSSPPSRSLTIRRQSSRAMRRQRSGTSSKHTDRAEEFALSELAAATDNFSLENKIGAGSFGVVYKGKLPDGREVAIKRGETGLKTKKFQEKESAFDSELAFLSRLHHKHLVRLVGFCQEMDERLLVYEYMKNGALYDHLHDKNNIEKSSNVLNSWKLRIRISLDAARGIEYLHNYAVPPIIHRDIKSSNILLDANWTARVSDFGLSLMGPDSSHSFRPMKAAGTVGYIDPEYYGLNVLTAKSDVYGLGVVLLELLTGKRAIFKDGENGGTPISVVDFAVPAIIAGELMKVLDPRVGPPQTNEAEAVELVAYTAMHCVNLEGKERPTMADIVANLERALALCEDSHGSISSGTISIVSD